jgi:TetR/AcrR family transcriptional regulator
MAADRDVVAATRRPGRPKDDARRRDLIHKTLRLLQSNSPAELSRLDIARAAGVDPALIRYYFGDKNKLFGEVVQLIAADIVAAGTSALTGPGTARERIRRFVRGSHAVHMRHPHYHQLILHQITNGGKAEIRRVRTEMSQRLRKDLLAVLRDGEKAGELRVVDPGLLGIAIIGMCEYFSSSWGPVAALLDDASVHERDASAEAYGSFIEDLVLRALDPTSTGIERPSPARRDVISARRISTRRP